MTRPDRSAWVCVGAIALAVVLMYGGVVVSRFGLLDDYTFLDLAYITPVIDETGRPINNFIREGVFRRIGGIGGLAVARAFGVVSIWAVGVCLFLFARRQGAGRVEATALTVVLLSLPPFQVVAAWAQLLVALWPIVLGYVAMRLVDEPRPSLMRREQGGSGAESAPRRRTAGRMMVRTALVVALTLAGLMIYQPAAMMAAVLPLLGCAAGPRPVDSPRPLLRMAVAFAAAMGLYALYVHFSVDLATWVYGGGFERIRSRMCDDWAAKLSWFVHEPLVDAWRLHALEGGVGVAVGAAAVGLAGLVAARPASVWRLSGRFAAALLAIPLAALPLLIARENYASFRSLVSLQLAAGLLAGLGLSAVLARMPAVVRRGSAVLWVAAAIAAVALGRHRTQVEFVAPQAAELALVESAVAGLPAGDALRIHVIRPTPADRLSPTLKHEFGSPSTFVAWTPEHLIRLVARQMGRNAERWEISSGFSGQPRLDGAVEIDLPARFARQRAREGSAGK